MSQIQRIFIIVTVAAILITTSFVKCLPVTSKPIENTPENLAWEAWLMLPPSPNERTRKITPKSIFILNGSQDGSNGHGNSNLFSSGSSLPQALPQIQCPPNHRIDNSKCIPTLTIDREKIMIQEFAQLVGDIGGGGDQQSSPNYNYEFEEYDYGDYNPESLTDDVSFSESAVNKQPDSSNEQPFKINLSLDKFPIDNKPKESSSLKQNSSTPISDKTTDIKPFLGSETATFQTTTKTIETTPFATTTSSANKPRTATTESAYDKTTSISTTFRPISHDKRRTEGEQYHSSTGLDSIKQINDLELPLDNENFNIFTKISSTSDSTTLSPILINVKSENSSELQSSNEDDSDEKLTTIDWNINDETGEFLMMTETSLNNTQLDDHLAEESLVFDDEYQNHSTETTKYVDQSTEDPFDSTTNFRFENSDDDDDNFMTTEIPEMQSTTSRSTSYNDDYKEIENIKNQHMEMLQHKLEHINQQYQTTVSQKKPIQLHDDVAPTMANIDSNNRFVYHHLGSSSNPPQFQHKQTTQSQQTANDIAEQLRIINMIVEENKRKSQQSNVRFPDNDNRSNQRDGLRADIIRFPEVTSSSSSSSSSVSPTISSFSFPSNRFDPDKFLFHRRYFQPSLITNPTSTPAPTSSSKPFWWLPDNWEVDQKGDRPLLIRFWSKLPNDDGTNSGGNDDDSRDQSTATTNYQFRSPITDKSTTFSTDSATTTTSGYRENSRRPTDNLYREISAQEVYKVLGAARQWKHSSKR